jgi:hypothetical protein
MKKLILFVGLMVFSVLAVASPVNFDVGLSGYSATGIANMDYLVDGSSNIVDVGKFTDSNMLKNSKLKSMLMPYSEQAKTGAGVYKTRVSVSYQALNCSHRHLKHEVGWQVLS